MAQTFLHHRQYGLAGFGEYHPVRLQPGTGKAGGEQIGLSQHPQDGTIEPRENAGGEQAGGGGVFGIGSGRGGIMQRA